MPRSSVLAAALLLCYGTLQGQANHMGAKLAGQNFSGKRLIDANFKQADLNGADFRNAVLRGADFSGADLTRANFRQADVRGAKFTGAIGLGTDPNAFRNALYSTSTAWPEGFIVKNTEAWLTPMPVGEGGTPPPTPSAATTAAPAAPERAAAVGTNPTPDDKGEHSYPPTGAAAVQDKRRPSGVVEEGKDVSRKQYFQQYLNGANFNAAKLHFTTFKGSSLQGATFKSADLFSTSFLDADLQGADFSGALIERINLAGANCNGAIFKGCTLHLNGWAGYFRVPEPNPDFKYSYELREAIANASSERLHNYSLTFKGADLRGTRIFGNLAGVSFRQADLRGADLLETEGGEARFFRGARYDDNTVWWKGFDPAAAEAAKLPVDTSVSPIIPRGAPSNVKDASGVAGYMWAMKMPGTGEERLLHIYSDGSYSWLASNDKMLEGKWQPATGGAGIVLSTALDGLNWTMKFIPPAGGEAVSDKGGKITGERVKPIK